MLWKDVIVLLTKIWTYASITFQWKQIVLFTLKSQYRHETSEFFAMRMWWKIVCASRAKREFHLFLKLAARNQSYFALATQLTTMTQVHFMWYLLLIAICFTSGENEQLPMSVKLQHSSSARVAITRNDNRFFSTSETLYFSQHV